MRGAVEKVIILPRYTSFAGAATFYTAPMNIRRYAYGNFAYDVGTKLGTASATSNVQATVQESPDLEQWNDLNSPLNSSGEVAQRDFTFEWIRLKIECAGTNPGFTAWCVANMVPREIA